MNDRERKSSWSLGELFGPAPDRQLTIEVPSDVREAWTHGRPSPLPAILMLVLLSIIVVTTPIAIMTSSPMFVASALAIVAAIGIGLCVDRAARWGARVTTIEVVDDCVHLRLDGNKALSAEVDQACVVKLQRRACPPTFLALRIRHGYLGTFDVLTPLVLCREGADDESDLFALLANTAQGQPVAVRD